MRQVGAGSVEMHTRTEMLDLIVHDGAARGIVVRDLITGDVRSHTAHAVVLATGGYGNVYYLSTNAMACNVTAGGEPTDVGLYLRIPVTHKFIPRAYQQVMNSNQN